MNVIGHHATCASIVTDDGEQVYECDCDFRSDVLHAYQNGERAATERMRPGIAHLLYVIDRLYDGGAWRDGGDIDQAFDAARVVLGDLMEPEGDS